VATQTEKPFSVPEFGSAIQPFFSQPVEASTLAASLARGWLDLPVAAHYLTGVCNTTEPRKTKKNMAVFWVVAPCRLV
jgi:hypothetical protein